MRPTESLSRDTVIVADTLTAMIKREQLTFSSWHVGRYLDPSDPTMITADDRKKLVNWCYHFVDHCQLSRETVASAMEMVDRFLSTASTNVSNSADADAVRAVSDEALRDQSQLQLLTVTALYVSIKINDRVAVSSDLFAEMCGGSYSTEEIEDMERILLTGLSWRCHAPTAHQVGLSILSLILPFVDMAEDTWGFFMDEMKYLIELTVLNYDFVTHRTSTIALAAIYNSVGGIGSKAHQELLRVRLNIITECFDFDHCNLMNVVRGKFQSLLIYEEDEETSLDEGSLGLEDSMTFRTSPSPISSSRSSHDVTTLTIGAGS